MVTIIIPTMNRTDFVIRQLLFYKQTKFNGSIFIGDSSSKQYFDGLAKEVQKLSMDNVKYFNNESLSISKTVHTLLEIVETKYVAIIGDDDFFIPQGIYNSVDFLEKNSDFIACHGKAFMINTNNDSPYGKINGLYHYRLPSLEISNMKERLLSFAADYTTPLFVVHRTQEYKTMYKDCNVNDRSFSEELLPAFIGPALGKYKEIDTLFLVRQTHQARILLPSLDKWMGAKKWLSNYSQFKNIYSKAMCEKNNNLSIHEAQSLIDEIMGTYIYNIQKNNRNNFSQNIKMLVKNWLFTSTFIQSIYQFILNITNKNIDKALMHTLSTNKNYVDDFISFKNFVEKGKI